MKGESIITTLVWSSLVTIPARRSHWFHTILISHTELQKVFNNTAMKKRYFLLRIPLGNGTDLFGTVEHTASPSSACHCQHFWISTNLKIFFVDY